MKIQRVSGQHGQPYGWEHHCPGCDDSHVIAVEQPNGSGARWIFDGNETSPTFSPSVNCSWARRTGLDLRCHYFIRAGQIQFCEDSTHSLAGQTVELPDLPA